MAKTCIVCGSRHSKECGRNYFQFPMKDPDRIKQWVKAMGRSIFIPKNSHKICSDHFTQSDYLPRPGAYIKKLKADSAPSLFMDCTISKRHLRKVIAEKSATLTEEPSESLISVKDPEYVLQNPTDVEGAPHLQSKDNHVVSSAQTIKKKDILNEEHDYALLEKPVNAISILPDPVMASPSSLLKLKPSGKANTVTETNSADFIILKRDLMNKNMKLKALQQKLRRKQNKIMQLKEVIDEMKLNGQPHGDDLLSNANGLALEMLKSPQKTSGKANGNRFSDELKTFATILFCYSPKAYHHCRTVLNLPHKSIVHNWIASVKTSSSEQPNDFFNTLDLNTITENVQNQSDEISSTI